MGSGYIVGYMYMLCLVYRIWSSTSLRKCFTTLSSNCRTHLFALQGRKRVLALAQRECLWIYEGRRSIFKFCHGRRI